MQWIRCNANDKCLVCAKHCKPDNGCGHTADHTTLNCTYVYRKGEVLPAPQGYRIGKPSKGDPEGMLYHKVDEHGKRIRSDLTPEQVAREDRRKEEIKARNKRRAGRVWKEATGHHPRVIRYLASRGIDVAELPSDAGGQGGRLPRALRFHPRCYEGYKKFDDGKGGERFGVLEHQAMVAAVVNEKNLVSGIHCTYLSTTHDGKRSADLGAAKKMHGECRGRCVRLAEAFPDGVLMLPEGIETGLSCMVGTGWTAWPCLDAGKIATVHLPEDLIRPEAHASPQLPAGPVHTLLIPEDLDKSGTGERQGLIAANALKMAYPWLTIERRAPNRECAPELVAENGKPAPAADGTPGKKVDWNDVHVRCGKEAVGRGLKAGIDVEAARAARASWKPSEEWVRDRDAATQMARDAAREAANASSPAPPTGETGRTRADAAANTGGAGGDRGDGNPPGGGAGGDAEGWEDWMSGGPAPWLRGLPEWNKRPVIEESPLLRARRYLWQERRVKGQGRFALARWGGKWWVYEQGAYREIEDERLRAVVWHWLEQFRRVKGKSFVSLAPTPKNVEAVMAALATDCWVDSQEIPIWLERIFDGDGRPLWGSASGLAVRARESAGLGKPEPKNQICFPSGRLDLARLTDKSLAVEERIRLDPHSTEFFTATCLPFDIPRDALRALVAGEPTSKLYERYCPQFWYWVNDASDGDPDFITQMQEMDGDTIGNNRSIEKIYGVVGLQRSGKGIKGTQLRRIVGARNIGALDAGSLVDRHGLAHVVGCSAVIFPDFHLDVDQHSGMRNERLKSMSGQDMIPIRDLYQKAVTVKWCARVWMFMNSEPEMKDESAALAGRMIWLPLPKGYLGKEDEKIKMAVESGAEDAGMMLFALEGAMRLAAKPRRAITICKLGQDIADRFTQNSAPIAEFVKQWLDYEPSLVGKYATLTHERLYNAYRACCELDFNRAPMGRRKFEIDVKWHLRPYNETQPVQKDGTRPRMIDGWDVKVENEARLATWINEQASKPTTHRHQRPDRGDLWIPA